jgi:hypothetical protein
MLKVLAHNLQQPKRYKSKIHQNPMKIVLHHGTSLMTSIFSGLTCFTSYGHRSRLRISVKWHGQKPSHGRRQAPFHLEGDWPMHKALVDQSRKTRWWCSWHEERLQNKLPHMKSARIILACLLVSNLFMLEIPQGAGTRTDTVFSTVLNSKKTQVQ